MRNKILQVFRENIRLDWDKKNGGQIIGGMDDAADELTQLMCYREVRAFMEGKALMEWVGPVIIYMKGQYESQIILNAIEQVKKETT